MFSFHSISVSGLLNSPEVMSFPSKIEFSVPRPNLIPFIK